MTYSEKFTKIAIELNQIDCSFRRCKCLEFIKEGIAKDYKNLSGRVEIQFKYIHQLLGESDNQRRYEIWHSLTNGQLGIEKLNSLLE